MPPKLLTLFLLIKLITLPLYAQHPQKTQEPDRRQDPFAAIEIHREFPRQERFEGHTITIDTRSPAKRFLFAAVVLALTLPPIYRAYLIFRANRAIMAEATFESYTRALEYDPCNSILWWQRGRISHYSIQDVNSLQAVGDYTKALSLNARIGQAWVDLADCYERMGRYAEAEIALSQACSMRPHSPVTLWQAGNYHLRRGNLLRMYEHFMTAAECDTEKLDIAMDLSWKADPNRAQILYKLIPDRIRDNLRYLDFLVSKDELDLARAAWERSLRNVMPPGSDFKVSAAFGYIDRLLAKPRISNALQVWEEVLQKAGTGLRYTGGSELPAKAGQPIAPVNLVCNGSFENQMLHGGFDWRCEGEQDVRFQVEFNNPADGLKCLRLTFAGSDISFAHLSQVVPLPGPGNYALEFHVRTEGLTTDQRPYFIIRGYPMATETLLRTPMAPRESYWQKVTVPLTVKANFKAVLLTLRRDSSSRFDNRLKGSLWLDGIALFRCDDTDRLGNFSTAVAQAR